MFFALRSGKFRATNSQASNWKFLFYLPESKFGYTLFFLLVPWPFFIYEFFTSRHYTHLVNILRRYSWTTAFSFSFWKLKCFFNVAWSLELLSKKLKIVEIFIVLYHHAVCVLGTAALVNYFSKHLSPRSVTEWAFVKWIRMAKTNKKRRICSCKNWTQDLLV